MPHSFGWRWGRRKLKSQNWYSRVKCWVEIRWTTTILLRTGINSFSFLFCPLHVCITLPFCPSHHRQMALLIIFSLLRHLSMNNPTVPPFVPSNSYEPIKYWHIFSWITCSLFSHLFWFGTEFKKKKIESHGSKLKLYKKYQNVLYSCRLKHVIWKVELILTMSSRKLN